MSTAVDELVAYCEAGETWRDAQEARLRADDGWLTVVGLFWLREGDNTLGSDPNSDVVFPARFPAHLGVIALHNGQVTLRAADETVFTVDDVSVREAALRYDAPPTVVRVGQVTFFVIRRGDQLAVRMRDADSEARRTFTGRRWFPIDPAYRAVGTFDPHPIDRVIEVETVIGIPARFGSPGTVTFSLNGQTHTFEAFDGGERTLWLVFRDTTSGERSHGVGRFLYAPLKDDGTVDLDFNKAVLPPCAFTDYATCPLPPKSNILAVPIAAGEQ